MITYVMFVMLIGEATPRQINDREYDSKHLCEKDAKYITSRPSGGKIRPTIDFLFCQKVFKR